MPISIESVSALIRDVADSEILPRFRQLAEGDIKTKGEGSVVTVADHAAELRLIDGLTALDPGSVVVAEELYEDKPEILAHLSEEPRVWIIDPIDGTRNFAEGKPAFAIIIAYMRDGEVVAGWIHNVVGATMAVTEHGGGAFQDGRRLKSAAPAPLKALSGALGSRLRKIDAISGAFGALGSKRCVGLEYVALASGDLHFAYYRRLWPWDHAAGVLMHREAGGYSALLDGTRYDPSHPEPTGLLLAPDEACWRAIGEVIRPHLLFPRR